MASDEDKLMDAEMERFLSALEKEELGKPHSDPVDVATIHAFTMPREPRTMGRINEEKAALLALIAAKGAVTKSRIRGEFVLNYMLMTRSVKGWGSEQAANVAKARVGGEPQVRRGMLGGMFQRKNQEGR